MEQAKNIDNMTTNKGIQNMIGGKEQEDEELLLSPAMRKKIL
jgi:hypothetical protein